LDYSWENIVTKDHDEDFIIFRGEARNELIVEQKPNGSWNDDVGDTAIATYGLTSTRSENPEPVESGIEWIQEQENEKEQSWGSREDDSKAIMARDGAGIDVLEVIETLMQKQKPDGSFGVIEETSWAVIALSTNPNEETMECMEKAMQWLRSQDYDNNEDLAIAALAEQYYLNAMKSWNDNSSDGDGIVEESGSQSDLIPPPLMFTLSILIISAIAICYWLFARLDRNAILEGIRKEIYTYILEHPGEHLANITKKLELSSSSTRYHLSVLEEMDWIVFYKNGKYKRYYVNKNGYSRYTNGNGYKHIMSALKNNTARKIVKFLISNPESNQKRVSNALKIHPSTVNWHAKRLRDAEIISKQKKGKEIVYSLNQDVQLRKVIGIIEGSVA
jgi:predicted transcriptional regulator